MSAGSGDDIDPTIRNWVIRKYEDGASRSEIKAELEGEVEDLSVVDQIIDSGQAKRKTAADPELFEKGFAKMYKGSIRGTIGMEEQFFRTISQQSVGQATGVMAANIGIVTLLLSVLPAFAGAFLGVGGLGIATGLDGLVGIAILFGGMLVGVLLFTAIAHVLAKLMGAGSITTTYNIVANMTALLFLALIPLLGYFVWLYALVVFVRALEEAHGIGFFRASFVTIVTSIAWMAVMVYGFFQMIPGFV
jgi:hypothetical protein